jgi:Domain of unknown function (DUF932)
MEQIVDIEVPVSAKQILMNVPAPIQTRTYKPIEHKQLIDITLESLDVCGFKLTRELYSVGKGGQQANGKYHLEYGNDPDMGLMIAWQNSYDKVLSLKFAVGTHVFICENGMVVGDMGTLNMKHVGEIQQITPMALREAVCRAGEKFDHMILQKERMKEIEVSKRVQAELLGRLLIEDAIITSTQLNIIRDQMKKPTFDYQAPGSVYEFYNHITHAQKTCTPAHWMDKQMKSHAFITSEFSIQ